MIKPDHNRPFVSRLDESPFIEHKDLSLSQPVTHKQQAMNIPCLVNPNFVAPPRIPQSYKPFSFALAAGPAGKMHVYYGQLIQLVTFPNFKRNIVNAVHFNVLASQDEIQQPVIWVPDNLRTDHGFLRATLLNWRGNAYLYWETNANGVITLCRIVGPDVPTLKNIPELNSDLIRDWGEDEPVGKYCAFIGSVSDSGEITQKISSDYFWSPCVIPEGSDGTTITTDGGYGGVAIVGGTGKITVTIYDTDTIYILSEWHNGIETINNWTNLTFNTLAGGGKLISIDSHGFP